MQERTALFTFTWLNLKGKYMYVTTGQTLTMALRIFFCTLGRSRKLAKNWDREKLKLQSTPDNSNLQGKSKKVRVIGSSKKIAGSKEKNSFYCTVSILITSNCKNVE